MVTSHSRAGKNGTAIFKSAKAADEAERNLEPEGPQDLLLEGYKFSPTFHNRKSQMCFTKLSPSPGTAEALAPNQSLIPRKWTDNSEPDRILNLQLSFVGAMAFDQPHVVDGDMILRPVCLVCQIG